MTRSTTKRTTARKSDGTTQKSEKGQPMDPSISEKVNPDPVSRNPRTCYSLRTLAKEVETVFPETTYEVLDRDAFGVALGAVFAAHESPDMYPLLAMITSDSRVAEVQADTSQGEESVYVRIMGGAHEKDSREPFGLVEAYAIMNEDDETEGFIVEDDESGDLVDVITEPGTTAVTE